MNQNDPKSRPMQPNATSGKPPAAQPAQKAGNGKRQGSGSSKLGYVLLFLLAAAVVVAYAVRKGGEEPRPVVSAAAEEAPAVEAEPPEAGSSPTAALVIDSNVRGADVYLNGNRVGKTPHKATPLAPGDYEIKVAYQGYETFDERMHVETENDSIHADLRPIEVETPARDGSETVAAPADIPEARAAAVVKHKHRLGSCEGVLRAAGDGVRYESEHQDAFFAAYSDIEDFRLDGDELTLKVREGRKYDFAEQNDDDQVLAAFHGHVTGALAQATH